MDHIIPKSLGGKSKPHNVAPAHRRCNNFRGNGDLGFKLTIQCRIRAVKDFYDMCAGDYRKLPTGVKWNAVKKAVGLMRKNVERLR